MEIDIEAEKGRIDGMSQLELARLYRFTPPGHPYFDKTLPLYDYFKLKFHGFTPEISKAIGWEG
uniref:Uncharacterized protein n=1 Tax=viral metagenome TaxID=1070528 RepID=A0A6M3J431_9ZZZZ